MRKLLFLVTEDWYFCSHRLQLAREARQNGYSVVVATHVWEHGQRILDEGFKLIPLRMRRRSANPLKELSTLAELIRIYRSESPDVVHHVAVKPVVYGSIAARLTRLPRVVNAITGTGYVFSSDRLVAKTLRPFIKLILRYLLNRRMTLTIFQNPDDRNMLIRKGIVREKFTRIIRGSGVDTNKYLPVPEPNGITVITLASRMLWDKGISEFVEAARMLKTEGMKARFVLVGGTDNDNFASIPSTQLDQWNREGFVEWWGKRDDMPRIFAASHLVCLPSAYGEGIPKVLIEAASCGRAVVTTDSPGCREIVRDGENGLLIPVRQAGELAGAIKKLIENPDLRRKMGSKGREMVVNEFSIEKVVKETLSVYEELFAQ